MMAAFIYRCPVTGYNVQAFVADDPTKGEEDAFRSGDLHSLWAGSLSQSENREGCRRSRASMREVNMDTQTRPQGGLTRNLWVQMVVLLIAVVVLIALAAKYIW